MVASFWPSVLDIALFLMRNSSKLLNGRKKRLASSSRSKLMARIRSKNTAPEMQVRRTLFSMGYRFEFTGRIYPGARISSLSQKEKLSSSTGASGISIQTVQERVSLPQIKRIGCQSLNGISVGMKKLPGGLWRMDGKC